MAREPSPAAYRGFNTTLSIAVIRYSHRCEQGCEGVKSVGGTALVGNQEECLQRGARKGEILGIANTGLRGTIVVR